MIFKTSVYSNIKFWSMSWCSSRHWSNSPSRALVRSSSWSSCSSSSWSKSWCISVYNYACWSWAWSKNI